MPHLIMKRSDLPAGLVQITDLLPNTSQRNLILDPPGQSGYCRAVQNDAPRLNTNGVSSRSGTTVKGWPRGFSRTSMTGPGTTPSGPSRLRRKPRFSTTKSS